MTSRFSSDEFAGVLLKFVAIAILFIIGCFINYLQTL